MVPLLTASLATLTALACGNSTTRALAPPRSSSRPAISSDPTVLTDAQRARDAALTPTAAAVVVAYPNEGGRITTLVAAFAKDKKRFLFGSTRSGVGQLYVADPAHPSESARALTTGPQRAAWGAFTHDDKYVLFTRDEGAGEDWRIYRIGLDGSNLVDLTPGPEMHREEPVLPRDVPDTMFYVQTSSSSQLVVQSISGGAPVIMYTDPATISADDVTADGTRVLLERFNSASDTVLLEVDTRGSKTATRVYPPEGTKARITWATYSHDGRVAFVATDEGKEMTAVLAVDVATTAVTARYAIDVPKSASVAGMRVSPTGGSLALLVDAGNHSEIRTLNARTLTFERTVATPLGVANIGPFTSDGKSFPYWIATAEKPADLYLADAATGESVALRDDQRPGLDALPPLAVSIESAKAIDGLSIPLNVYLPKGDSRAPPSKLPTIVAFHGGPSSSSAVRWSIFTRFFTAQGYAVVEPNIRGSTGFGRAYQMADNREKRAEALSDVKTVNAWVKAQPWCDANRVIAFGASYGGYLSLMAITRQPSLWRAAVDISGMVDLTTFMERTGRTIRAVLIEEFGDPEKDALLLKEFSPSRDFDKIVAPLFVYAGQNDPRVPRSESDQIVVALRQRGVPVEYMVAPDEGTSVEKRGNKIALLTRVMRFLDDHVK